MHPFISSGACASVFVAVAALVACSDPPIPSDLVDDQNTALPTRQPAPAKTDAGAAAGPAPAPAAQAPQGDAGASDGAAATGPTGPCAGPGNKDKCWSCCEVLNPKALSFLDDQYGRCMCLAPGACAQVCAGSFCNGGAPSDGDPCDKCITANDGAYTAQAEAACALRSDCQPVLACYAAAQGDSIAPW